MGIWAGISLNYRGIWVGILHISNSSWDPKAEEAVFLLKRRRNLLRWLVLGRVGFMLLWVAEFHKRIFQNSCETKSWLHFPTQTIFSISNSCPNHHVTSSHIPEADKKAPAALHALEHSTRLTEGDCRKAVMELLDNAMMSSDHWEQEGKTDG